MDNKEIDKSKKTVDRKEIEDLLKHIREKRKKDVGTSSYRRDVATFPITSHKAGLSLEYFSGLPDVEMKADVNEQGQLSFFTRAYVDKETASEARSLLEKEDYVTPKNISIVSKDGCLSTVEGDYERVYAKTVEIYCPKVSDQILNQVAKTLTYSRDNDEDNHIHTTYRVANKNIVVSVPPYITDITSFTVSTKRLIEKTIEEVISNLYESRSRAQPLLR